MIKILLLNVHDNKVTINTTNKLDDFVKYYIYFFMWSINLILL